LKKLQEFFGPKGEGGQAIVMMAISLLAMLFVVGLAIDSGQLFIAKRTMQEAADAAAFAGAVVIYQSPGTDPRSAVRNDGTLNGYTDNQNQTVVTVNWPPASGAFINNTKYVEVIIVQQVKTSLVPAEAAFNPVRSRSVAGADPVKSPFALMALKPTGPCITLAGTGNIDVSSTPPFGGMAQANCTGNSITFGSGKLIDGTGTRTVGTVSNPAGVQGPLTQNASKQPDPFVAFPRPVVTGLPTFNNFVVPASACNVNTPLTPGVYTGGITNDQNCNVYLGNGPFILKGGGLSQNASSGNITTVPAGAMIFNTNSSYPAAGGTCGSVSAQSGGGFDVYAMTTGTYAGMALYQDAACGASVISVQSNGSYDFHGTVYAPTATIDLQSQSSITMHAQIVAYSINFQSSGNLNILYDPSIGANSGLPTIVE
jgi:Flp pilus assembly protein TadG